MLLYQVGHSKTYGTYTSDLHWQHLICLWWYGSYMYIGKKLPSAEGNILSTQNNVIQPMNNHFQFSANKIMLYVYINMLPCKCSVCCQILCHIPILTC